MGFKQNTTAYLFVYGTLLSDAGHPMGRLLRTGSEFVTQAKLNGKLYLIKSLNGPFGTERPSFYPACVPSDAPGDTVRGELYALSDPGVLDSLDDYEECGPGFPEPQEYVRRLVGVETDDGRSIQAWVYLYNRLPDGLKQIEGGRWHGMG